MGKRDYGYLVKELASTLVLANVSKSNCKLYSYAAAKRCSNEGRALMQLDFQQLLRKLETVTDLKRVPEKEYVENYIKGPFCVLIAALGLRFCFLKCFQPSTFLKRTSNNG